MKKALLYPVITLSLLLLLFGCQADRDTLPGDAPSSVASELPASSTTQIQPADDAADVAQSEMWRVELHSAEFADSLTTTLAAIQYGGDILETISEINPESGKIFLLLELTIEKIGTGKASFSWGDAYIEDADGNVYHRHPNDTFLSNLNIPRIKGTDIVFGNEYGYACFEIPNNATGLRFVVDEGKIGIKVNV